MPNNWKHLHGPGADQFPAALGAQLSAASFSVVFASDASLPITLSNDTNYGVVGASTLRTASQIGNATGAASFNAGIVGAQTLRVVVATDQPAIGVTQSGTWTIVGISGTISLPTGAATEATLAAMSAKLPASLGAKTSAASFSIVPASDASFSVSAISRARANAPVTNDFSSTAVTTAAYTQLIASTTSTSTRLYACDTSGSFLIIAVGAAASEIDQVYLAPGFSNFVDLNIPAGSRVSIKALDTTASAGRFVLSLFT